MTHRLMYEHVGKHAKMHKSEECQTGDTKQAWQATSHGVEKGYASSEPALWGCISQVVISKQALIGMEPHKASGPKD